MRKKLLITFAILLTTTLTGCGNTPDPTPCETLLPKRVEEYREDPHPDYPTPADEPSPEIIIQPDFPTQEEPTPEDPDPWGTAQYLHLSSIPLNIAAGFFAELDQLHTRDGGQLWGVYLHTPFIFVDPGSRDIVANQPDPYGILTKAGDVYIGTLPYYLAPLYTAWLNFGGQTWAMKPWHMVAGNTRESRLRGMSHLAFHNLQPTLFGEFIGSDNSHLDEKEAGILLLLEVNALLNAFNSLNNIRDAINMGRISDALSIRARRRQIFGRAYYENRHEIVEGTAQYTEYVLNVRNRAEVRQELYGFARGLVYSPTLMHPFGYVTGALYAFLLDETGIPWRCQVTASTDLAQLLKEALEITELPPFDEINLLVYGYLYITRHLTERHETRQRMVEEVMDTFTTGPVLRISGGGNVFFSGHAFPLQEWGELARMFRGRVESQCYFGSVVVFNGDLIICSNGITILATGIQIEENRAFGDNWEVTLNDGFEIIADGDNFAVINLLCEEPQG